MAGKKLSHGKHTPDILEKGRSQDNRSVVAGFPNEITAFLTNCVTKLKEHEVVTEKECNRIMEKIIRKYDDEFKK